MDEQTPRSVMRLAAIAGLSASLLSFYASGQPSNLQSTMIKPFQITAQELSYGGDSTEPHEVTAWNIARRSDGSHMVSFTVDSPEHEKGIVVEIFDFVKLTYASLEPFTGSVSTYRHTSQEMAELDGEKPGCAPDELALAKASDTPRYMLGYLVVPITTSESDGDGGTKWVAPALDCYPLKETQLSRRGSRNEFAVTAVAEGEPSAALFTVPANYVERPPSQVDAEYWSKYNEHLFDDVRRRDQEYYKLSK